MAYYAIAWLRLRIEVECASSIATNNVERPACGQRTGGLHAGHQACGPERRETCDAGPSRSTASTVAVSGRRPRGGRPRGGQVLGPNAQDDRPADVGGKAAAAGRWDRQRSAAGGVLAAGATNSNLPPCCSMRPARKFIGGMPISAATKRLAGRR